MGSERDEERPERGDAERRPAPPARPQPPTATPDDSTRERPTPPAGYAPKGWKTVTDPPPV